LHSDIHTWHAVIKYLLIGLGAVFGAVILGFGLLAWRSEIEAASPPKAESFDAKLVERGGHLAALGNCISCHTVRNGEPLTGGVPIQTPYECAEPLLLILLK
jgi:mono/diheme cytochrome c family protein